MKKRNKKGNFSERIEQVTAVINQLRDEAGHAVSSTADEPNELNQAMNELLEEEDAWKKKYF